LGVLVVSQSPELSRLVRTSLTHEAWLESLVADCETAQAARARLEADSFDLIVVEGGPDEVRALVEWSADAAIVAVAAGGEAGGRDAVLAAGAVDGFSLADFDGRAELFWNSLRQTLRYHASRLQHRRLTRVLEDRARQIQRLSQRLLCSAPYDGRTGWMSHAYTVDRCQEEIGRAVRYGMPLSLLLIEFLDVDPLDPRVGRDFFDEALVEVAARIRSIARHTDLAGHFGAESILLILTNTDQTGADRFFERVRQALAPPIEVGGVRRRLEWCSAAVTRTGQCDASPTDILNRLEQRIEEAKANRRHGATAAERL
jgi:diguanylate cyclase (GGDEF)-like protein